MSKIKQFNTILAAVIAMVLGIVFALRLTLAEDALTITITNPTDGSQVSGIVSINAEASSSAGIQLVDFQVDGVPIASDSAYPYSVSWDTTSLIPGSWHTLLAIIYDFAGQTTISTVSAQIAPIPTPTPSPTTTPEPTPIPVPTISISSPVSGSTVKKGSVVTIVAQASDIQGINKIEFYVNNSLTCTDTTSSYTCNWKVPAKSKVSYTLTAKAYNLLGITSSYSIQVISR